MSNFHKKPQQEQASFEPHRDYEFNLDWSKKFITKMESGLPRGVSVLISSSHHFPSSLLMISWTAPRNAQIGNFAVPTFMHVPHYEFVKKAQGVFDDFVRKAKNYWARHPDPEEASA